MKKTLNLPLALTAVFCSLLFFTSCSKDEISTDSQIENEEIYNNHSMFNVLKEFPVHVIDLGPSGVSLDYEIQNNNGANTGLSYQIKYVISTDIGTPIVCYKNLGVAADSKYVLNDTWTDIGDYLITSQYANQKKMRLFIPYNQGNFIFTLYVKDPQGFQRKIVTHYNKSY